MSRFSIQYSIDERLPCDDAFSATMAMTPRSLPWEVPDEECRPDVSLAIDKTG